MSSTPRLAARRLVEFLRGKRFWAELPFRSPVAYETLLALAGTGEGEAGEAGLMQMFVTAVFD